VQEETAPHSGWLLPGKVKRYTLFRMLGGL